MTDEEIRNGRVEGGPAGEPAPEAPAPVLAAGCVLWRRREAGPSGRATLEVCLVHRPKYDDWSHPKGKLKRGEGALAGALREVKEETGCDCAPGIELPTAHYLVDGHPKEVRYWAAEARGGTFAANSEVDRLAWLAPDAARARLTQERDREVLDALLADLP
ncbi:NUDIX hydrolase [Streptomyces sp. NBC_00690]|uniref:NUDIX hydrolase n=1 Tax=Streptomyces sp. NBC_00690 TaxID=2975808 RepID=UPI002E28E5F3|nr:NUDIX hydrolase [Streptomyces sp. NBC_00690]